MNHALVVGAGVGGLTASLCLAEAGWKVSLFERAASIEGIGAGLQISPNASRVLIRLGLGEVLQNVAFLPKSIEMRDGMTSALLSRTPLDDRWGAPYWHIHRGDLVEALLASVTAHPDIQLHTGIEAIGVEETGETLKLRTANADYVGDVLIGADGIHSVIRRSLFGEQSPRFTGNVAYRGLVSASHLEAGAVDPVAMARLGPGAHFVHYYVRGGELVNCVAVVEQAGWENESWVEPASIESLRAAFDGWDEPVPSLIDAMVPSSVFRWALYDRKPMPIWRLGRATLLGDACHATLPFMAQGAAMAIEDAAVLARCVSPGDVDEGLERYGALRRPRTAFVQNASRRNATVYHLSGLPAKARNLVLPYAGERTMEKLYGFDVYAV